MPETPHLQLHGVDEAPTLVTLVAAGLWVVAEGTDTLHEAVGEEALAALTAQLLYSVLDEETALLETPEDVLGNPWRHKKKTKKAERSMSEEMKLIYSFHLIKRKTAPQKKEKKIRAKLLVKEFS